MPEGEVVAGQVRIVFPSESDEVPPASEAALKELAAMMMADPTLRLEILAYASGGDEAQANRARRLSLSRALAVRSFLIDQDIRSTRMDVRAEGSNTEVEPADRVDIVPKVL